MPKAGVIATLNLKPETADQVIQILNENLVKPSQREGGNQFYQIMHNPQRPNQVFVMEMYKDQGSFESHTKQPYFKETIAKLLPFFNGDPDINVGQIVS